MDALDAAYPAGPLVDVQALGRPPLKNPIIREQVLAALKGFDKGFAPGPTGVTSPALTGCSKRVGAGRCL